MNRLDFKMRISSVCQDKDCIWLIDEAVGGLYSADMKTLETECAINSGTLYRDGKFAVEALVKWEEYVIIIPRQIDKSWIFYNKVTGELEYRKVVGRKCHELLAAVSHDGSLLYFYPEDAYDPILMINLNTLACEQVIENWSGKVSDSRCETAWKGAYSGQYIFFTMMDTSSLVRIDCVTQKVEILELDIPEKIRGVDYAFGELWIISMSGNRIYQIDENGRVLDQAELTDDANSDVLPDFARIIVQKRYLFLLPYYWKGIYVYDKLEKNTHIIPDGSSIPERAEKEKYVRYWEYYVRENQICFLPYWDGYLEVDLDTLSYKKRELLYPVLWTDGDKAGNCIWSHVSPENAMLGEVRECNLDILLKYIQNESKGNIGKDMCTGKKIWDVFSADFAKG